MAKKGLLFVDSGVFTVRFERAEPINRRFHLEYADDMGSRLKDEKRQVYEECGWTVVNDFKLNLVVVYTDDEFAPEPYDDRTKMAEPYEKIYKNQRAMAFLFLAMAMLMKIAYPVTAMMSGEGDILDYFLTVGTGRYIIRCVVFVLLICECTFRFVRAKHFKEYIKCIKTDEDYKGKTVKKNAFGTALILLIAPLIILFCVQLFTNDGVQTEYNSQEYSSENYPFPSLAEINAEEYAIILDGIENGESADNYIYENKDLLSPKMLELWQCADGETGCYYDHRVFYYKMKNEKLAHKMFEGYIEDERDFDGYALKANADKIVKETKEWGGEYEIHYDGSVPTLSLTQIANPDATVYYAIEHYETYDLQRLYIQYDDVFERICYEGASDLSDYVDLYIAYLKK